MRPEPVMLPLHAVHSKLQPILDPRLNDPRRMAIARAALPLPPADMAMALAFLIQDPEPTVAAEAKKSLTAMPEASVLGLLASHETHPAVLDALVRHFHGKEAFVEKALLNRVAADATLLWVAQEGKGQALELIAQNQARLMACPALVKVLYFNRNLRMATSSALMEFAVRANLPIQDMHGYAEIAAAVLGEGRVPIHAGQAPATPPVGQPPAAETQPAAKGVSQENEEALQNLLKPESEDELKALEEQLAKQENLEESATTAEEVKPEGEKAAGEDKTKSGSLYDALREMTIPERIRLALMGNMGARKLLAADSNRLVAGAVMRNPGLTEKEVALMAANKAANDEVIRIICSSREFMKNYRVKLGLVRNPKTPPGVSANLLKHILERDLKALSKSRDVPVNISRAAKRTLDERNMARRKEE